MLNLWFGLRRLRLGSTLEDLSLLRIDDRLRSDQISVVRIPSRGMATSLVAVPDFPHGREVVHEHLHTDINEIAP